jgi:hypothetical protein
MSHRADGGVLQEYPVGQSGPLPSPAPGRFEDEAEIRRQTLLLGGIRVPGPGGLKGTFSGAIETINRGSKAMENAWVQTKPKIN